MLEQVMADNGFPVPLVEGGNCRVFQFHSGTGEGIMTQYDLFPGVSLMYNDFHMESYDSAFRTTEDLLCIDYCRQGRMEYPAGPDAYSYVEAGDLKLDRAGWSTRAILPSPLPIITGSPLALRSPRPPNR